MTSYETRSTQSTAAGAKGRSPSGLSSSEQNDMKKLKSKHASKLNTLKELFADWSDEDLLFAIEEANGDLELAVDRISEGHVSQWGEVKTKKSKKEQKAKTPLPSQPPASSYPHQPARGYNNERPKSVGKGAPRPARAKPAAATWGRTPSKPATQDSTGTWASIASAPKAQDTENTWDTQDTWNATPSATITSNENNNNNDDGWGAPSEAPSASQPDQPLKSASSTTSSEKPKTWASLLKSQPKKPEPEKPNVAQETREAQATESEGNAPVKDEWKAPTKSEWDAPVQDEWTSSANKGWEAPAEEEKKAPVKDEWSAPTKDEWSAPAKDEWTAPAQDGWTAATTEPVEPVKDEAQTEADNVPASEPAESTTEPIATETTKSKQPVSRRLKQDAPVVLPNSGTTLTSVGVKFGSLNLDDNPPETEAAIESNVSSGLQGVSNEPEQQQPQQEEQTEALGRHTTYPEHYSANTPAAATGLQGNAFQANQNYMKSQQETTSAYTTQQPAVHAQQPQPLQQQPFGMDHLTSAYNSYLPNQPPAGVSGAFGITPMANLPDYGIYGTEAQRAAAAMGYYDPAAFNNSPSVTAASAYQTREKYNQDAGQHTTTGQTQTIPQQQQQQIYPTNLPYYQYYYMPNQFSAYQQTYGQPFMNKSMYPNMYQHSAKPTTASPYGGSPYGTQSQHLYNQSNSGYDDMSGLPQHLGMGGLHDYQKSTYTNPQLQGFLNLSGQQQQQQQQQQQSQGQSQQSQGQTKADNSQYKYEKANTNNGASANAPQQGTNMASNMPHQQAYHHPGANYFGQPQMFSYQQYPHHLQQFQQQPQQQTQQAQQTQQQPSQQQTQQPQSMGRQQQYWNQ
ncbi:RNAPII degradation factor [Apophysomyces ossiformis]|uniref:RNA polymerase II degradation factor 1 n=1 Tax=Apophysomyces ossiformis TaxID=679940 RepID=A0A8H7BV41_9FUNG|nr:RNAPII degradation factor [Apophysomyces ossiformis]